MFVYAIVNKGQIVYMTMLICSAKYSSVEYRLTCFEDNNHEYNIIIPHYTHSL